jgi:hypothetical protein
MMKWVTVGLVAVGSLFLASVTFADVPSALNSTVSCYCTADPGGGASSALPNSCTITPSGTSPSEDVHVDVIVRNVLGVVLAGSNVIATGVAQSGAAFIWDDGLVPGGPGDPDEDPQTLISNALGEAFFVRDEGGVSIPIGAPLYPTLQFNVTAQGPGIGDPVPLNTCAPALNVVSYDMTADGVVSGADLAQFAGIFGTANIRGDFNHSGGAIGGADLALFSAEFGASINNQ